MWYLDFIDLEAGMIQRIILQECLWLFFYMMRVTAFHLHNKKERYVNIHRLRTADKFVSGLGLYACIGAIYVTILLFF